MAWQAPPYMTIRYFVSAAWRLCCVNIFRMQPAKTIQTARRHPVLRAALWLIAGALLFLAVIQSLTVTVAWWRNELQAMRAADWFWILLLPVLIGIYLRFFSIFRPDCRACLPEDRGTQRGPRAP